MQKLDFVRQLETLVERLQSNSIVQQFNGGFNQSGSAFNYSTINPLLFISKSNYDQLKVDDRYQEILKTLKAEEIYSEQNLSRLTSILKPAKADAIIVNANALAFYNFHNALVNTLNLAKGILTSPSLQKNLEDTMNDGVVVFQIVVEGEGLDTEKYIKIFAALQELIQTIGKVINEDAKSEIVLLDSGSDTNLGIKTGIETAKSLFLIFKEIWDYITQFRHYKLKQKNQTLLDSLSLRAEIKKKVEEGVLTEEEGKEYVHMIKTRTDDLIAMKVLPKQIVLENNVLENKKLLSEFEGLKMISGGEN